jgi:hypothetical protein
MNTWKENIVVVEGVEMIPVEIAEKAIKEVSNYTAKLNNAALKVDSSIELLNNALKEINKDD